MELEFTKQNSQANKPSQSIKDPDASSTLTFVKNNYPNAPILKVVDNYRSIISEKEEKNEMFQFIVNNVYTNEIHKKLSEYVVALYWKKNPAEQSIWGSDTSRYTFVIKQNNGWFLDKSGIIIKETIILPFISYIRKKIKKQHDVVYKEFEEYSNEINKSKLPKKSIEKRKTIMIMDLIVKLIISEIYETKNKN